MKLDDQQAADLQTLAKDIRTNRPGNMQKTTQGGKVPPIVALSRLEVEMVQEARKEALSQILQPAQAKRVDQLGKQAVGLAVFEDVMVLKALQLTAAQANAIEAASIQISKTRMSPLEYAPADPKMAQALWATREAKLQREAVAATVATFDDMQKKAWGELAGHAVRSQHGRRRLVRPAGSILRTAARDTRIYLCRGFTSSSLLDRGHQRVFHWKIR